MMHPNLIPKLNIKDNDNCEICVKSKLSKKPFKTTDRDSKTLELVHNDVWDFGRKSKGGNKYFMTFIDDCSKYCHLYLIKTKDEVIDKFKIY